MCIHFFTFFFTLGASNAPGGGGDGGRDYGPNYGDLTACSFVKEKEGLKERERETRREVKR